MPPDRAPPPSGTVGRAGQPPLPHLRRRAVLQVAGAALVGAAIASCGVRWDDVRLDDEPTPTPPVLGPDDLARFAAVVSVQALLDLATAVADPGAAPVAERHRAHLAQLGPLPGPVPSPSATPSGWPIPTPSPTGVADLPALAAAEQAAAAGLLTAATAPDSPVSGGLALLLVSVGSACGVAASSLGAEEVATPLPAAVDPDGLGSASAQLAAVVEAHHAAAYAYGVLAVRLADQQRAAAQAAIGSHQVAARHLVELAAAAGVDVPPGRPAYVVTVPADVGAALALALGLELDVATAAGSLVAGATGGWRTLAARHLAAVALDASAWGEVPDFPGAPALG